MGRKGKKGGTSSHIDVPQPPDQMLKQIQASTSVPSSFHPLLNTDTTALLIQGASSSPLAAVVPSPSLLPPISPFSPPTNHTVDALDSDNIAVVNALSALSRPTSLNLQLPASTATASALPHAAPLTSFQPYASQQPPPAATSAAASSSAPIMTHSNMNGSVYGIAPNPSAGAAAAYLPNKQFDYINSPPPSAPPPQLPHQPLPLPNSFYQMPVPHTFGPALTPAYLHSYPHNPAHVATHVTHHPHNHAYHTHQPLYPPTATPTLFAPSSSSALSSSSSQPTSLHAPLLSTQLPILHPWYFANKTSLPPRPLMSLPPIPPSVVVDINHDQASFQASLSRAMSYNAGRGMRAVPVEDVSLPPQFVSEKQYARYVHRAAARKRRFIELGQNRSAHKHRSRQLHAARRVRGKGGRFLTKEEREALAREEAAMAEIGAEDGENDDAVSDDDDD